MAKNVYDKYSRSINTLFSTLYSSLQGQKVPLSDVTQRAKKLFGIVLPDLIASPEHNEIIKIVVDRYVCEVGIQTYDPEFIDEDKESKYWLYQAKETLSTHAFFDRYRMYLASDGFEEKVIDNIETSCEQILARCANPKSLSRSEKKKGLVVGDVQSGKTANYLGLINMAYDYGYRIVILLAGTTTSLRRQTQKRTDKGVIGAVSDSIGNNIEFIGVGLNTHEHFAVPFTNQVNDFKKYLQNNLNVAIADINKPVVLVVKKVKSVLESVSDRLQSELNEKGLDCKSILIIDDEADNASVSTSRNKDKPSTINRCIRDIFNKFPIASYVGYTATPFANIFINPFDDHDYMDLFPSDFIAQLRAPSTYFGGRVVFPGSNDYSKHIRVIIENEPCFLPVVHDKNYQYVALAESLKEAIHSFLICNVIRTIRGDITKHRSMMINITRFNDVQQQVLERVKSYLESLDNAIEQLCESSEEEFCKNSSCRAIHDLYLKSSFFADIRSNVENNESSLIEWSDIQRGLYDVIKSIQVVVINSKNGTMSRRDNSGNNKRFEYDDYKEKGARVIAIGGMVLSRGLTLEGLMTSYYSRNAGAYDTLLQMCRWFGYRPNYSDLCRIYLSQNSIDQFDAVLTATEDLKTQFTEMRLRDKKPTEFGLMVKECPDTLDTTLLITNRGKMRGTKVFERYLNYSGVYADTSKLTQNPLANKKNLEAVKKLFSKVQFAWRNKNGTTTQSDTSSTKYYMACDVSQHYIAELLSDICVPIENKKFNTDGLAEYAGDSSIFPVWDVVIANGASASNHDTPLFYSVTPVRRSFYMRKPDDFIRIGGQNNRVLDPGLLNAGLWLDDTSGKTAKAYCAERTKPILIIFPIDLNTSLSEKYISNAALSPSQVADIQNWMQNAKQSIGTDYLIAFAYAFPSIEGKVLVKYRANAIKIKELTENIEIDDDEEGADDIDD